MTSINAAFQWKCQPQAEGIILKILEECIKFNPMVLELEQDLLKRTSTRLFDWVDHVTVTYSQKFEEELEKAGFTVDVTDVNYRVYRHLGAQLPFVVLKEETISHLCVAISVESIADFLMTRGMTPSTSKD